MGYLLLICLFLYLFYLLSKSELVKMLAKADEFKKISKDLDELIQKTKLASKEMNVAKKEIEKKKGKEIIWNNNYFDNFIQVTITNDHTITTIITDLAKHSLRKMKKMDMIHFLLGLMNSYSPELKNINQQFWTDFCQANAYRVLVKFVFDAIANLEKMEQAEIDAVLGDFNGKKT